LLTSFWSWMCKLYSATRYDAINLPLLDQTEV
jgi:hypothetical protein